MTDDGGLSPEQLAFNAAFEAARAPALRALADVSSPERWQLAHDTVAGLEAWQPDGEDCRLESVEVAASGPHEREPQVVMAWRQGTTRHRAVLSVDALLEMADYENLLHLPERPSACDWLGLLMLAVYEPHGRPPDGAASWIHLDGLP